MPSAGEKLRFVEEGERPSASGHNDIVRNVRALLGLSDGDDVLVTGAGVFRKLRREQRRACAYYHVFEINGGKPTSGSQIWSYTIDADTQDVTITFDMTASQLETEFLSEFAALAADDIDTDGGPLPEVPIRVRFRRRKAKLVSDDWPPTVGTNTLNNSAWMKVYEINPRS